MEKTDCVPSVEQILSEVLSVASHLIKEATSTIEDKQNLPAVKGAANKLKNKLNELIDSANKHELFVFQKITLDELEDYIITLEWIQTLPKKINKNQVRVILIKFQGFTTAKFPLETSKIFQEEIIDWENRPIEEDVFLQNYSEIFGNESLIKSWKQKEIKEIEFSYLVDNEEEIKELQDIDENPAQEEINENKFICLFDSEEEMKELKDIDENPKQYVDSFEDIIGNLYTTKTGCPILKSRIKNCKGGPGAIVQ